MKSLRSSAIEQIDGLFTVATGDTHLTGFSDQ
jgi:hypothetical protein